MDVAACIAAFNRGRDPERLAMKFARMRESPFVFLRGACHLFYDRLPRSNLFAQAPAAWLCGDLHFENFGSYKGDDRQVYFDISDFDETALGPCTWDVVRFVASVILGASSLSVERKEADDLCRSFVDAYGDALGQGQTGWIVRETANGLIRDLLDKIGGRSREDFLDSRTERDPGGGRRLRVDGRKALAADEGQRETVRAILAAFAAAQAQPEFFRVRDVARRIAGTGSLGVDRYVILVEGRGGAKGNFLLDLKATQASSLSPHLRAAQPAWPSEADRVVTLQRRMQAVSMAFLHPLRHGDSSYVLRELLPSEDRVALDRWNGKLRKLEAVMDAMGRITAWAHLRASNRQGSGDADQLIGFGRQQEWRRDIIDAAQDCATQAAADWRAYCEAFDAGYFAPAQPSNGRC